MLHIKYKYVTLGLVIYDNNIYYNYSVADPGFDLRGGVDFVAIFLLKSCIKEIASKASEEKNEKKIAFWALKNHRSAAVRGGAHARSPPLDPLVLLTLIFIIISIFNHILLTA